MERLFWATLGHLEAIQPGFGLNRKRKGVPRRFKAAIHAVDSSTIQRIARCLNLYYACPHTLHTLRTTDETWESEGVIDVIETIYDTSPPLYKWGWA